MKIALYSTAWPPGSSANGIVTYASYIVPILRELGHEVFILTPTVKTSSVDPYTIDLNKFSTHRLWNRVRSKLFRAQAQRYEDRLFSAILSLKREHKIDLVEMEESFGWSATISEAALLPVVVRLHGPWFLTGTFDFPSDNSSKARVIREGRAIANATLVTSPSAAGLTATRSHYGLPLDNASVIPNAIGIPPGKFQWTLEGCDRNRILYVGRFDRLKGADLVLHAFQRLAQNHPALRLTFVGPDKGLLDRSTTLKFDEYVRKNYPELRSRIDYFPLLSSQEVLELRRRHLFTVVASRYEMFSYTVAEAISCGCPVIAPAIGGISELIEDGKTGSLYESGNTNALISGSERLLNNNALLCALGSAARQFCERNLNATMIAEKTVSAYKLAVAVFAEQI